MIQDKLAVIAMLIANLRLEPVVQQPLEALLQLMQMPLCKGRVARIHFRNVMTRERQIYYLIEFRRSHGFQVIYYHRDDTSATQAKLAPTTQLTSSVHDLATS